jgi:hypothetical protein
MKHKCFPKGFEQRPFKKEDMYKLDILSIIYKTNRYYYGYYPL